MLYPVVKEISSEEAKSIAAASSQSRNKSKEVIYVVRKGDTISQIASAHNVPESQLRAWNSLKRKNKIYAGQELVIRKEVSE